MGYYSSGSDDEISLRENRAAFKRVWFRPKNLKRCKTDRLFVSITRFYSTRKTRTSRRRKEPDDCAGQEGINSNGYPTLASCAFEELVQARAESQNQWYQVYVNQDREKN
ncbi:hypothetical protein PGT21_001022 [Puccinia graminis f. sp. tritici]|uniref:FMN-dependent dehydrogenase domain-containing protein n=1 Tax=Puccinia graminis f. sp. tritici TaxID=56615 RepID=A0A5B0MRU0_PUCGR|nr:hypothetical protein PGT21_001022 [Puccinia graminis f. sp. tritici]